MRGLAVVMAAMAVAALAGCSNEGRTQNSADVRFLHAALDAEALDVLVDDDVKASGVGFGSPTGLTTFESGSRTTKLRSSSAGTVLLEKSVAYASASNQTLVIHGRRNALQTLMLNDDTPEPDSGRFKVRVLGLSADAGAADVYVTAGEVPGVAPNVANVGYGSLTEYVQLSPGSLRLVVTAAGTKEVLFEADARDFAAGSRHTVAIFPAAGGKLVNAVLVTGGGNASATFLANKRVRLRAVNADPAASGYVFKSDSATLLTSVPYRGVSSYVLSGSGSRTLSVERTNVPGVPAASLVQDLKPARDYTLLATGSAGSTQLALVPDDNSLPGTGRSRVRFVNAFADGATVDALLNFASAASSIGPRTASAYAEVAPGDSYTATFTTPGGVNVVASLGGVKLESGGVYSVYGFGAGGAAEARLVRDR